jgi:hypothetical protein
MKKLLLIGSATLLLATCTPVAKMIYGIKKPDIENEQSVKAKALKFGLDTTNIVTVTSAAFLKTLNQHGIPDAGIYDANGKYIEYRASDTACNAGLFKFIPELSRDKNYNRPDSLSLAGEFKKFRDLKGRELKTVGEADFYVLLYWSVWTGKLNTDHVKVWEDAARNNKSCKIEVIKVNLDIQEYWDKAEREKYRKALR